MNAWWQGLAPRERSLLALGVAAILAAAVFLGVLEPLQQARDRHVAQLDGERSTLARVRDLAAQAAQLRGSAAPAAVADGTSLLFVVNASVQASGIQAQLERVDPNGADEVSLSFAVVPFDTLVRWLVSLRDARGVEASRLVIDPAEDPGMVKANLTLAR